MGLTAKIVSSRDSGLARKAGLIINETKQTIQINTGSKILTVPKQVCIFAFTLPSKEEVVLDGRHLIGRPEDRIGKVRKYI
jgi:RNase P/RNase MRP subunit p29